MGVIDDEKENISIDFFFLTDYIYFNVLCNE